MRRKLLSDSAATGVQQQSTIYIQDVSIRRYQLKKIYGSKHPGYRLLIVVELQWLRHRSITFSSLSETVFTNEICSTYILCGTVTCTKWDSPT